MIHMAGADSSPVAQERYEEVDVTGWAVDSDETLGTKPKRWLRCPDTGERWLMKDTTDNPRRDGTFYRKGDDWSERIANEVARHLGLPAAHTELALRRIGERPVLGVISKSFVSEQPDGRSRDDLREDMVHGNQLLAAPAGDRQRSSYTVEAVQDALDGVLVPTGMEGGLATWDVFVGYLVLDAVVGNSDRHEENWAVIDRAGQRRLAPTFDHASCLGYLLDDSGREKRLSTRDKGFTPEAWADRAKSPFAGRLHPIDVVKQALAVSEPHVRRLWIDRCRDVDRLVEPIWMVPEARMSVVARRFAERVLRRNCLRLAAEAS